MTFKEWFNEGESWGGASFDGTFQLPQVNTPSSGFPNSKYGGENPDSYQPSFMKSVNKKYGMKNTHPPRRPIQDQVPKIGRTEKDKEEKEGRIRRRINYGTEDDGDNEIHGKDDPVTKRGASDLVDKMYKVTPTYKLKNMRK